MKMRLYSGGEIMKNYEKPILDVILIGSDLITATCDWECPTETPEL